MKKIVLWCLGMSICGSTFAGFIESKNPTKCPNVNVNSHLHKIVSTYYPDIINASNDKNIHRFNSSSVKRMLEDYRRNVRQFGIDIAGKNGKKRTDRDLDEYRYKDDLAHPLVWTIFLEKPEILRSYMEQDAALRDVVVAIGLTRAYSQYRRYSVEFADLSVLNYPLLAIRIPFEDAKKYLAPHPQYRRLLDHLTILNAEYKDVPHLVDEYIAKYPDYTETEVKTTSISLNTHAELLGMKGAALLFNGDKFGALRLLMKYGDRQDISMIAEQILTTDELKEFVDSEVASPDGKEYDSDAYAFPLPPHEAEFFIRNLLARRLMREGREPEAVKYFNGERTKAIADFYFTTKAIFDNPQKSNSERAMAAMELGMQLRRNGDLLRGTSLEPDHTVIQGYSSFDISVKKLPFKLVKPDLPRFHYRYIAMDWFRRAAELTPDAELKSVALWMAGAMLKYRAPKLVEPDFKQLAKLSTQLGEDANKRNWFPPYSETRWLFKDQRFYFWWEFNDPNAVPAWERKPDYIPFERIPDEKSSGRMTLLMKELKHSNADLSKTGELLSRQKVFSPEDKERPFALYPGDLLLPLNRMALPGYCYWSETSPKDAVGRLAFLFRVEDVNIQGCNYFLLSAPTSASADHLRYLGKKQSLPHLPLELIDGLGGPCSPLNNMVRGLDQNYPLPIYNTDFAIPLNRLRIVGGEYVSDSVNLESNYGTGGSPRIAFLFYIDDTQKGKKHYFLVSGPSNEMLDELKYLGDNITLLGRKDGNGLMGVRFTAPGVKGEIISSVSDYGLCGSEPDQNCASVKTIPLWQVEDDGKYKVDETRDLSWLKNMTVKQFFARLQKAVADDDRKTVAKMMDFPMGVYLGGAEDKGYWTFIRSEQEFIDKYDRIVTQRLRDEMEQTSPDNLFISWRGAMRGQFWMLSGVSEDSPASLIDQIGYFRR